MKKWLRNKIASLFRQRYYVLHYNDFVLNMRVDIFGRAQYLKNDPALQLAAQMHGEDRKTPLIWMNLSERNAKSDWVKEYKNPNSAGVTVVKAE